MAKKTKPEVPQQDIVVIVECPDGFNDFSILRDRVLPGGQVEVSEGQFKQMKQSMPSVVVVNKIIPLDSEAGKKLAEEKAKKDEAKRLIRQKYEKDAPPRVHKPGATTRVMTDTRRPVSPAELVHLPVTEDAKE
jgi:hypothetical protein